MSRWTERRNELGTLVLLFSTGLLCDAFPGDGDRKSSSWLVQKDAEKKKRDGGERGIEKVVSTRGHHAYLTLERGRRGPR